MARRKRDIQPCRRAREGPRSGPVPLVASDKEFLMNYDVRPRSLVIGDDALWLNRLTAQESPRKALTGRVPPQLHQGADHLHL